MAPRKRVREEEAAVEESISEPSPLQKLRNMWQFASLMQYITLFGSAVRIDPEFDIDDLERESLQPQPSEKLANIGLALLKFVSSHKPLTLDNFDEYTRRQFMMKAPHRNPFGIEDEPAKFANFDIPTKISVLQQLSVWTWGNADRMRALLDASEEEQLQWRMDPFGWDSQLRVYFVLHDRLYRRTEPPLPPATPPKPKSKAKKPTRSSRASKRRRMSEVDDEDVEEEGEEAIADLDSPLKIEDDRLGGATWECLAVTLEEYNAFLEPLRRSRNRDEKDLIADITQEVLPELEKHAEAMERKAAKERRELEALQKMATAKRSSRLAGKMEKQKELEEAANAERRKREELTMAHKEEGRRMRMEEARESRMMTREQRLKEREVKRILHEEELAKLESRGSSEPGEGIDGRLSARNRKAALEKTQRRLEELNDDANWDFDCAICGIHGKNLDDGTHSIACEKCGVWQHSACHGIREADAESDDFHFVCASCRKPKLNSLKIRLNPSTSPQDTEEKRVNGHIEAPFILPSSEMPNTLPSLPSSANALPPMQQRTNGLSSTMDTQINNRVQDDPPFSSPPRGHFSTASSPSKPPMYANGSSTYNPSAQAHSPSLVHTQAQSNSHNLFMNHLPRQRPYTPVPGSTTRASTTSPARTPSLSATQGQTSIRFSPTASPGGHMTHSYSPVFNQPSAAALSPIKQPTSSPSPQQPALSPTQGLGSVRLSTVPNYPQSGTASYITKPRPVLAAGSPVKRTSQSPSPPPLPSIISMQMTDFSTPGIRPPSRMLGSGMSLNGGLTPTLSPSVNAVMEVYETPMKRSFSGGAPPF